MVFNPYAADVNKRLNSDQRSQQFVLEDMPNMWNQMASSWNYNFHNTALGSNIVLNDLYDDLFQQAGKHLSGFGEVGTYAGLTGAEKKEIILKNEEALSGLFSEGKITKDVKQVQQEEINFYKREQDRINASTTGTWGNTFASIAGSLGGIISDPSNALLYGATFYNAPFALAGSRLGKAGIGGLVEAAAETAVQISDQDIERRRTLGEEISTTDAIIEKGLNVGVAFLAGSAAGAMLKPTTPEALLKESVDTFIQTTGKNDVGLAETATAKAYSEIESLSHPITPPPMKEFTLEEAELTFKDTLRDLRAGKMEDEMIQLEDGTSVSLRESLEDFEASEFISKTISDCLNKGE
jgi:hypothetical protein